MEILELWKTISSNYRKIIFNFDTGPSHYICQVLTMENFEHLGYLIYFGEKGSEKILLSQNAPFFANSDPDMPAVPVPAPQVHDWLLENISSALEHISERVSMKENGPTSSSDQDVPMADVSPSSVKSATFNRGPSFIEGISKSSCMKQASDLQGSSVKVIFFFFFLYGLSNVILVYQYLPCSLLRDVEGSNLVKNKVCECV